jgi:type II secretory pathway pseudopilin PulG
MKEHPVGDEGVRSAICGRRAGFSLIELAIVTVFIGIVMSILMPQINVSRMRTESAAREVQAALLGAQRAAIQRQHDIVVAFDTAKLAVRVHSDRNSNGVVDGSEPVNYTQLEKGVAFGRGTATALPMGSGAVNLTRMQDGLPAVTFTRAGNASEFGGFYLRSTRAGSTKGQILAFEIDRGTGRTNRYVWALGAWKRGF